MALRQTLHPSPDDLDAFGLGVLNDSSAEAVSRHLEECPKCRQAAEAEPGDGLLDRLRAAHAGAPTARLSHSTVPSLAEGWRTDAYSGKGPRLCAELIPD